MKKNDFILVGIILVIAIGALLYINATKESGDKVIVTVDGRFYQEYPLDKEGTYEIIGVGNGLNTLVIEDGHADVIDANCPDKLCVYQKNAEYNGESIVCLPNKVVVEIRSDKESGIDSIAN